MEITKEDRIANLKKLEQFFDSDLNIKKILMESAPTSIEKYDEQGKNDYSDRLYNNFKDLEFYFDNITRNYFEECRDIINNKLKEIKSNVFKNSDLSANYTKYLTNMNENFIKEVKNNCKGYYNFKNVFNLIENSSTVNELLHAMHSYITNDEEVLQALPIIEQKQFSSKTADYARITLYGEENKIAKEIFDKIIPSSDAGFGTDIVALKDRVLMMVRDRGHALSIEIDTIQNPIKVDYFIPKICNEEKVNMLRGIDNVNLDTWTATGRFDEDEEKIADEIIDFIQKVPTDADMPRKESYPILDDNVLSEDSSGISFDENIAHEENGLNSSEEENSLIIVKQNNGIFDWIKNKFQKIKNKFINNKDEKNTGNEIVTEENNKQKEFKNIISENGKLKGVDEKVNINHMESYESKNVGENQRDE